MNYCAIRSVHPLLHWNLESASSDFRDFDTDVGNAHGATLGRAERIWE